MTAVFSVMLSMIKSFIGGTFIVEGFILKVGAILRIPGALKGSKRELYTW